MLDDVWDLSFSDAFANTFQMIKKKSDDLKEIAKKTIREAVTSVKELGISSTNLEEAEKQLDKSLVLEVSLHCIIVIENDDCLLVCCCCDIIHYRMFVIVSGNLYQS